MHRAFAMIVAAPADGYDDVCASLPDGHVEIGSPDELRRWLERIAAEVPRPLLVEVIRADGDMLSVGVGRPRSFVTYIPADGDPPYFSVLDPTAGGGKVLFDCNGEPTPYAAEHTVPFARAVEIACCFAASAGLPLPGLVAWEEF